MKATTLATTVAIIVVGAPVHAYEVIDNPALNSLFGGGVPWQNNKR